VRAALIDRVTRGFAAAFGGAPDGIARAPGRVNLIGEHTDYNDGFVLPAAIGVETMAAWRARDDGQVVMVALDRDGARDEFALAGPSVAAPDGWADYGRGMAAEMRARGLPVGGADMAIAGTVPQGNGLSSSASLELAIGHALAAACGAAGTPDPATMALAAQAAERFAGVNCGIMDQLAIASGQAGSALLIDCRSLDVRAVAMPADCAIMIVQSGVVRGLADGHYNQRRQECEDAARAMGVTALRDADLVMLERYGATMDPVVHARARHVIGENARTLAAADALAAGDLVAMGRLMALSHASLRDDFAVSVAPVDRLVDSLSDAIGSDGGARMTGGGFGGAVVALMRQGRIDSVRAAVSQQYRTPAGQPPAIMIETAASGAGPLPG
jgi:galactokinase